MKVVNLLIVAAAAVTRARMEVRVHLYRDVEEGEVEEGC